MIFKRKFRWTISGQLNDCVLTETFCKVSTRPSLVNKDEEKKEDWIPGKQKEDSISVTLYDPTNDKVEEIGVIFREFYDDENKETFELKEGVFGTFELKLYDGCGTIMETWTLNDAVMSALNFGDFNGNDFNIEITIKYHWQTWLG